jgi:hypothetical protein
MDLAREWRGGVDFRDNVVSTVSKYSPEERYRILQDSRELLERLNAEGFGTGGVEYGEAEDEAEEERPAWPTRRDILDPMTRSSAPMQRWREEQQELEATRARERMRTTSELNERRTRDWEAWAVAIIDRELAAHDRNLTKVLGELVSELRQQWRAELNAQIGQLRAELNTERSVDESTVIDLPPFPLRRKADVA